MTRSVRFLWSMLFVGVLAAGAGASHAAAQTVPAAAQTAAAAVPTPIAADATPDQILDAFQTRWAALKDYSCELDTIVRRGDVEERSRLTFEFKRPKRFKSKVLEGRDVGSWVWIDGEGRIRARGAGALKLIKITMKEDDPRLADPRGARLQDGDWGTMVGAFLKRRDQKWTFTRLPDEKIKSADCCAVQTEGPADKMGETREVFYFSKTDLSVRSRRLWEGAQRVDLTFYENVKLDQGLADEDFNP